MMMVVVIIIIIIANLIEGFLCARHRTMHTMCLFLSVFLYNICVQIVRISLGSYCISTKDNFGRIALPHLTEREAEAWRVSIT